MPGLPAGLRVLERGWLSSNNILIQGRDQCALIDSGYYTHAAQTLALVQDTLGARPLDLLLNTHLHSDHCGGNAALQAAYGALQTHIPPGHAEAVRQWYLDTLGYAQAGQACPRFAVNACLPVGGEIQLGDSRWQVHAAPGHDPHSVILFEPASRTLVSADALWERGFGVVFLELEGQPGFDAVAATLDHIESLRPALVIPGHGTIFTDVAQALAQARQRLDSFVSDPARHDRHAAKVLLKFKLLSWQQVERDTLLQWVQATPHMHRLLAKCAPALEPGQAMDALLQDLQKAGVLRLQGSLVLND